MGISRSRSTLGFRLWSSYPFNNPITQPPHIPPSSNSITRPPLVPFIAFSSYKSSLWLLPILLGIQSEVKISSIFRPLIPQLPVIRFAPPFLLLVYSIIRLGTPKHVPNRALVVAQFDFAFSEGFRRFWILLAAAEGLLGRCSFRILAGLVAGYWIAVSTPHFLALPSLFGRFPPLLFFFHIHPSSYPLFCDLHLR